jgi:hypothetical protein
LDTIKFKEKLHFPTDIQGEKVLQVTNQSWNGPRKVVAGEIPENIEIHKTGALQFKSSPKLSVTID